jgi:hypothetical protein
MIGRNDLISFLLGLLTQPIAWRFWQIGWRAGAGHSERARQTTTGNGQ